MSSESEKAKSIFDRNLLEYRCGYYDVCLEHDCDTCKIRKVDQFDYVMWESMRKELEEKRFSGFLSMEEK